MVHSRGAADNNIVSIGISGPPIINQYGLNVVAIFEMVMVMMTRDQDGDVT